MKVEREEIEKLIEEAFEGRKMAYAPYSQFLVGTAILCDNGKIYKGCNIENGSYGASNCGERTAIFSAISNGDRQFRGICVVGGKEKSDTQVETYAYPCGICRQVMSEFVNLDSFFVIIAKSKTDYKIFTLREILPHSFEI